MSADPILTVSVWTRLPIAVNALGQLTATKWRSAGKGRIVRFSLPMPRKALLIVEGPGPLSRKRTAEMLRRLRALTRALEMLKVRLDAEAKVERQRPSLASHRKPQPD